MLSNYLAAALRYLGRNRLYSAISVFGLAIGLWGALLALVEIRGQYTQTRFVAGYESAYMLLSARQSPGQPPFWAPSSHNRVAELLRLKSPQVESTVRIAGQSLTLRRGDVATRETVSWVDAGIFRVLPMPVVAGDPSSALDRPDGIVLSRSMARKYFGRDDPIGETLLLEDARQSMGVLSNIGSHPMVVGGVIEDLSDDTSIFGANIFASGNAAFSQLRRLDDDPNNAPGSHVLSFSIQTIVRLKPGTSIEAFKATLPPVMNDIVAPLTAGSDGPSFFLEPVRIDRVNTHPGLNPSFAGTILMLEVLGGLVLAIGAVNFVNLLTARSSQRALEVGVRKVAGASRATLMLQFLGEAALYAIVAMVVAVALTEWSLPAVNAFLNAGAEFRYWSPSVLAALLGGAIVLAVMAGAYPALVLSAFRPLEVMKGLLAQAGHAGIVRHLLVTLQFAVLIGLVVCAGVVYLQRIYATQDMLRADTDQVLLVFSPCEAPLVAELRALGGVRGVACSGQPMINMPNTQNIKGPDGKDVNLSIVPTELGALSLYGIRPIAGEIPSADDDSGRYVINESAVRRLGYASAQDAIGKQLEIRVFTMPDKLGEPARTIVGVIPDFSFTSVERPVEPIAYVPSKEAYTIVSVKLAGRQIPETLAAIDRAWRQTGNVGPINRTFLDEVIQRNYLTMLRQAQAFGVFVVVAVLLACLGLLGLAASTVERRTKEIGIRKALGAATHDVMRLLLWQFSKPVLWANLLAWPLAALAMRSWLRGFAYHIDLPLWLFPAASLLALSVAIVTVSAHSFAVARARPMTALRYE